jgi:hypothetical protein
MALGLIPKVLFGVALGLQGLPMLSRGNGVSTAVIGNDVETADGSATAARNIALALVAGGRRQRRRLGGRHSWSLARTGL